MTIDSVSIGLIKHGSNQGRPAVIVTCGTKQELDLNSLVVTIRKSNLGLVFIEGNPSEYPQEIRDIIRTISNLKIHIVLCCDAIEAIENYRRIKTLTFCLKTPPPSLILNGLRKTTFALLKPTDNLVIQLLDVKTIEKDLDALTKFLMTKTVAHPLVSIEINSDAQDKKLNVILKFLEASPRFTFSTQLYVI